NINQSKGLDNTVNQVLQRNNLMVVKTLTKENTASNSVQLNILYYPLVSPIARNSSFPVYSLPRKLLNKPKNYNNNFRAAVSKI
ncbi:MAG TPA: hypothetical protein VHM20_05895, partial [Gammaproteobacteria bacterium]|nr:hypothetical protein [Gammaproteobacteria bacterium]